MSPIKAPSLMKYIKEEFLPFAKMVDNGSKNVNELQLKLAFLKQLFYWSISELNSEEAAKVKVIIDSNIDDLYHIGYMIMTKVLPFSYYNYIASNITSVI